MAQTYEARLGARESIQRVQEAKRAIERVRGKVEVRPTKTAGMVIVMLTLPDGYQPEMFLPGIPFFLV